MQNAGLTDPLGTAVLDREIVLGGVRHSVRPPTLREAVEILNILPSATSGEEPEDTEYLLDTLLAAWLPGTVLDWYKEAHVLRQAEVLNHLILTGCVLPKQKPAKEKKGSEVADSDWTDALARYVVVYGGDAWRVFNDVPFPFFCLMLSKVDRGIARRNLINAEVAILPHTGKESEGLIRSLRRRAGYVKVAGIEDDDEFVAEARKYRAQYELMKAERESEEAEPCESDTPS